MELYDKVDADFQLDQEEEVWYNYGKLLVLSIRRIRHVY
jgi:hypothetical protein